MRFSLCAVFLGCCLSAAAQTGEQAVWAGTFLDSVGINAHWGYGGSRYADSYPQVKRLLMESGIRHVRGDASRRRIWPRPASRQWSWPTFRPTTPNSRPSRPLMAVDDTIQGILTDVKKNNRPCARLIRWKVPTRPTTSGPCSRNPTKARDGGLKPQEKPTTLTAKRFCKRSCRAPSPSRRISTKRSKLTRRQKV